MIRSLLSIVAVALLWVQVPQWQDDWSQCAVMSRTSIATGT